MHAIIRDCASLHVQTVHRESAEHIPIYTLQISDMNIKRTKQYYESLTSKDVCQCDYCQNYIQNIKTAYPQIANYLQGIGVDIERPSEVLSFDPDGHGYIEYCQAQYIVFGSKSDFCKMDISDIHIDIQDIHPCTNIEEEHFVIALYSLHDMIRLKWMY